MSQADFTIADQDGASFLVDINAQLAAIVSQSSGATEPAITYAYQYWADTSAGILKRRNAANSAWIDEIDLATGAPIVLADDSGSSLVGFISDLSGATPRNIQSKSRELISSPDIGGAVVGDITLSVPSQFSTIQSAIDFIKEKRIAAGTTVKIQVADGTYNLTAGLNLNHPDGSQIQLLGNVTTPANVVLSVAGSGFDCLTVSDGNVLGLLDGFTFFKTVKALAADNTTAILANKGARIICGTKIVVDNWYYGIAAREHSHITCPSAQVDHSGDVGIWAFCGSEIFCDNAVSNNSIDVANNLGFGFQAEYGSVLNGNSISATGCRIAGIASLSNSSVRALGGAVASTNTGSGFLAKDGATIECHAATANNNTRYGVEELADGHVYYSSITTTGNTIANINPNVSFDNGALGARIAASNGNLRIDNNGAGATYFSSSGGVQFGVVDTASAVNSLVATGSATGQPPSIAAQGSDAVIDIAILPKGAGSYVKLGAGFVATGDVPSTGYIEIRDNLGTLRRLMVRA